MAPSRWCPRTRAAVRTSARCAPRRRGPAAGTWRTRGPGPIRCEHWGHVPRLNQSQLTCSSVQHVSSQWSQARQRGQQFSPYSVHVAVLGTNIFQWCNELFSNVFLLAAGQVAAAAEVELGLVLVVKLHVEAVPLLHLRHRLLVAELDRVLRRVDVQRPAPAAAALAAQVDAVAAAGGCKYFYIK